MFQIFSQLDALQITFLITSAILIGINKTAIPGLGLIPVMMLASVFETRLSTGVQLGMLATADLMAVAWYRRGADWKIILRLFPWALVGLAAGSFILHQIPVDDTTFMRRLIGGIVLFLAAISFIKSRLRPDQIPSGAGPAAFFGILMGTTTQLANAAGPVSSIYLLAMKLPKDRYMGTAAWYFLILNWIKVPIFFFEGRITGESILIDLAMIPVLIIGAAIGILMLRKIPQQIFERIIQVFVIVAAVKLLFF